jgi:adenylate cyclase
VRWSIVRVVVAANLIAAVVLFVLLAFLIPDPDDNRTEAVMSFAASTVFSVAMSIGLGAVMFRPIERWLVEDRPATDSERAFVLGGPRRVALVVMGFWVVAALSLGGVEAVDGGPAVEGARDGLAVLAGGVTSASLSYLLVERRIRPLIAAALEGRPPTRASSLGMRSRLVLSWALGSGVPLVAILSGELSVGPGDPRISSATAAFLVGVGLVVGAVMTTQAVRSVTEPLDAVGLALAAVQDGDLSPHVPVDDGGEIGRLQAGVNDMVAGLRERQQLEDLFGRHVGEEVARRAVDEGVRLGGERREASALFVDLDNSTGLAASTAPEEVVAVLNRFFAEVVAAVTAEGGWVNKFEGDGAMCIFGAPAAQPDHAAHALRAGRALCRRLQEAGLSAGIGISSGQVVAGNVGTEERYEYTVIGDPVNEAARITEQAKQHAGGVLAGEGAVSRSGDEATQWRQVGEVELRGRPRPTALFAPV